MALRPVGTITFLFTDIEGSTRLWQHSPAVMQLALARHDVILRAAIEAHHGYIFKTIGDAFCAAFPTAPDALAASLAAQWTVAAEEWHTDTPIRVRMALHTGATDERNGDYFGPPLNRVARLLSAGYGGQILVSLVTQGLLRDTLPAEVSLRSMGEHHLRDLSEPEHIFQVVAPGLMLEFPPLKTLDARPNNLPPQLTPFIGREKEVAKVGELLLRPGVRLLTLTGPGGTGKTRLALQVAADLLDQFEDGAYFVNLAPTNASSLVASTIAQTLDVRESGTRPLVELLRDYLRPKQMLLVLDNFEHVVAASGVAAELIAGASKLKVLVTSRVVLYLRGEHGFAVPPLATPNPKRLPSLDRLTQYEAVRLFIERAQAAKFDFAVTNENAAAVAEICFRLEGLPLAIELAAARIRSLSPQAMLTRLQSRLKFLTGGARDLPTRQQTLRGTIEWSYDLLDEGEKALFRRLAVFVGGRTLEAIEEVCNASGDLDLDVLDGVASLVDKSLLGRQETASDESRYVMLEMIHELAREKLLDTGEAPAYQARHAAYFLRLAEKAEPELTGPDQLAWLSGLEVEHANLRTALQWAVEHDSELGLRLGAALWHFWEMRSHLSEGRAWLEQILERAPTGPAALRASVFTGLGTLAWAQVDYPRAATYHEAALALYRHLGDQRGIAFALNNVAMQANDVGDYARAEVLHAESLVIARGVGDARLIAYPVHNLGEIRRRQQDYSGAEAYFMESLALSRVLGDRWISSASLFSLAQVANRQGDYTRAASLLREGVTEWQQLGNRLGLAFATVEFARLSEVQEQWERAARLYGAADALLTAVDGALVEADRPDYEASRRVVLAQLGELAFARLRAEGAAMSLEEAVAYALEPGIE